MKKWVEVTRFDASTGKTKVIALAVLDENGELNFIGQAGVFPPEIATLDEKTVTLADGMAYLLALPTMLDSAYAAASNIEEGEELPNVA
ncbi:hypothetical protein A2480_00170 [Candidatus Uhrbacteria bacterium RIFOXYC2_FULL_47_19]|uniref:Uncharacterized protein n=1 Tax=Candidatus Uhrbacteria bacterium RIFOXYC2_FULL_47_19 TaxID=1802424 RepID=A0A1F7WDK2_9BACT|nr:MAG: hypothetical protein A2480_00170 [Candidatus Uhrbacteria bacterium RIFOXYC2_FULL_47_19]HCC21875.1 hypothetical protein [Candidatus Uhrbacteria bacterium]